MSTSVGWAFSATWHGRRQGLQDSGWWQTMRRIYSEKITAALPEHYNPVMIGKAAGSQAVKTRINRESKAAVSDGSRAGPVQCLQGDPGGSAGIQPWGFTGNLAGKTENMVVRRSG
jgi:hypothetical protein